jgi:hypothetical protein
MAVVLGLVWGTAGNAAGQAALNIDRAIGPVEVSWDNEIGLEYQLEETSALTPDGPWNFLATLASPLTSGTLRWTDARSGQIPQRFYRTVQAPLAPEPLAPDFRLLDQLGRTRHLYYSFGASTPRAVVLIFSANGCSKLREMRPTLNALMSRFSGQGVQFWLIESNPLETRSNILVQATSMGWSNNPSILHDTAQVVTRTYGASALPEAVAINMAGLSIFYRGAIDDRVGPAAIATTQHYLSNALSGFLAAGPFSVRASRAEGCDIPWQPLGPVPSYADEIVPILQNRCVRCHSEGNIAPWAMSDHAVVASQAENIRHHILNGNMPPWHADSDYGGFSNDSSLRPAELAKLVQWLDAGAPRGTGVDPLAGAPPTTNYPVAWPSELGQPDAILRIPAQSIPATGTVDYRYINVTNTAFAGDVWLRAAVVRPTNRRVVHHCLVFQGTGGLQGLDGFFAGYVPGFDANTYPAGTGKRLRRGEVLRFQMHYTTVGTAETDQTEIGFYLQNAPSYELQTKSAFNVQFVLGAVSIPANRNDFELTAQFPSSGTLTTNIIGRRSIG